MNRKRFLVTSIAILMALVVGAALNNILYVQRAQAQGRRTIPKSWGTLKGSVGISLIFEDSTGTIRFVGVAQEANGVGGEIQRN